MHPEIKISQRKFENLKPYYVRGARERDRQTCMCRQHVEFQIILKDEIQSQYFDVNKASIHVTILYKHSGAEVDGIESTEEEPAICKEHLFVISVDVTQDHDSVLHIQKLISKHLEESNCTIKKIHEFTDGWAGQHKRRHC